MKAALLFVICSIESNEILTVFISILTLVIAIITLIFTIKTFKSQKNTEDNTAPIFTPKKQFEACEGIAYSLLKVMYDAFVVKYKLTKCGGNNSFPEELLFPIAYIDPSEIHLELFFKKGDKTSPNHNITEYTILRSFKDEIISYNKMCDVVSNQVQNQTVSREVIGKLLDTIIENTFGMLTDLVAVTSFVFDGMDDKEKKHKKELQNHIFWDIFTTMLHKYNWESDSYGFILNFKSNLEELEDNARNNLEALKNDMDEIDVLFENTEEKWREFMGDYEYPKEEENFFRKRNLIELIMSFVKLIVAKKIVNSANDFPTISYNVTEE